MSNSFTFYEKVNAEDEQDIKEFIKRRLNSYGKLDILSDEYGLKVKGQPGTIAVYGYKGTFNIKSKDNNKFGVEFEGKIYPKLLAWLTSLFTIITILIFFSYPLPGFLLLVMGILLSILSFIERKKPKNTINHVMTEIAKEFD